jgi:hypothetical protein
MHLVFNNVQLHICTHAKAKEDPWDVGMEKKIAANQVG